LNARKLPFNVKYVRGMQSTNSLFCNSGLSLVHVAEVRQADLGKE
jgi:hypothetical protein